MMDTAQLLVRPKGPASKHLESVVVLSDGPAWERKWDGPILKACGNCDQAGWSTCTYVGCCPSLAWGHNFKRAFGGGFWKHYLIALLLLTIWVYSLLLLTLAIRIQDAFAGLVASILTTIIGIIYAVRVRTAIRNEHGIMGSKCQDCLAWTFCAPCALCQESRTLAKNNIHNGVWYGETVLYSSPTSQPLEAALKAPKPVTVTTDLEGQSGTHPSQVRLI